MASPDYETLRMSLKRTAADFAVHAEYPEENHTPSELAKFSRIREVLHLGVMLCNMEMGTAGDIKTLIGDRVREIETETVPFIPNPFEINEAGKRPNTSFAKLLFGNNTESLADEEMLDVDPVDDCDWETGSNASSMHADDSGNAESQDSNNNKAVTIPNGDQPLKFESLQVELNDSLADFEEDFLDVANNYYEIQKVFRDGIKKSITPRKGQTPDTIWDEVEQKVNLASVRRQLRTPTRATESFQTSRQYGSNIIGAEDEEEDEEVRRMISEVAAEESDDDVYPLIPVIRHPRTPLKATPIPVRARNQEPTHDVPTMAMMFGTEDEQLRSNISTPTVFEHSPWGPPSQRRETLASTGRTSLAGQNPQASSSVQNHFSPPPRTNEPRTYTFARIQHAGAPLISAPPIMQRFYRSTAQNTLEELLNSTESEELKSLIQAYWEHVEKEIPASPSPEHQPEPQPLYSGSRPAWLRTTFGTTPTRWRDNQNGWR
ncbi:hypothetical protein N0V83_006793 [Neocucurbitaria cava]|uniref:Uncharacterized protein n=1 Tax=Neocucurbitaria cava TaxID=798079 RepID=A0A9W8Y5Q8_9PLEO|nr:hypothetical protein N0V83_006793 [Neocucurbitaria cava]